MFSRLASSLPIAILSLAFSGSAGAAHGGNCTDVPLRFTLHESAVVMNLDGTVVADSLDLFIPSEGPQEAVFTLQGLAATSHTLTIEVTGLKNPASAGFSIVVDAFDVTP